MLKLYKHQKKIVDLAPKKHLLAWETGTGKSLASIKLAEKSGNITLVICPKSLRINWLKEIKQFSDPKYFVVLTKEEFKKMAKNIPRHDTVIVDECFVSGTKVLTKNGYKKIEDIDAGEYVKNSIGWGRVSMNRKHNYYDDIIEIKLRSGKVIRCTKEHPFLTQRGWENAGDLTILDVLLTHSYVNDIMSIYTNSFTVKKYVSMFKLWKNKPTRLTRKGEKNVFKTVSAEISMEKETPVYDRLVSESSQRKTKSCFEIFNKDEEKQSNGRPKNKEEGNGHFKKNGSQTNYKRRKWPRDACPTKSFIGFTWQWMVWRACSLYKKNIKKCSTSLQSGYCKSSTNGRSRSGRPFPQLINQKEARRKKNKSLNIVRMESISVHKQRSNGKSSQHTKVYNLTVGDHPSYTVEDIIVHNCHYFSGIKSQMSKALLWYINKHEPEYLYFLTATPYMSTPWNIYTLAKHFGKEWSYQAFKYKFFNDVQMGHRMIPVIKKGIEPEISKLVSCLGSTLKLSECLDVPDSVFKTEYFELTKEQERGMEELEASVPIAFWTKCHQICGGTLKSLVPTEPDTHFKAEKLARIVDLCTQHDKVAVICRYNAEIAYIKETLEKKKGFKKPIYVIQGVTKEKDSIVSDVNSNQKCVVLIQSACSEGYNMPGVPIMVFYSYDFSLKNYIQMRGRIQRINAVQKCVYISLIVKGSVDEEVYKSVVVKKQDFQIAIYAKDN